MRRIETEADIAAGMADLLAADPRLIPVAEVAGPVPLRRRPPGFDGLARIVCGQQLSVASAAAIWRRMEAYGSPLTAERFLAVEDATWRATGLSAGKLKTLRAVAIAEAEGRLSCAALADHPADEATAQLTALPGIGPWTAEIYLLFCAGHPDIWPGGDLALQVALAEAFGLSGRPTDKVARGLAAPWSPWRGVAARLMWAYYGARRAGRQAQPG
jgi:DNA-3-methyladenine glycosylase II